ncbi:MAG: PEP-CTERM sorting domain-containing protein [Phycisphaerae bacterium]
MDDWVISGFAAGGTSTSWNPPDARQAGSNLIDVSILDSGTTLEGLGQFNTGPAFTWFDGDNAVGEGVGAGPGEGIGVHAGVRIIDSVDASGLFEITAPADLSGRSLAVFVGFGHGAGRLRATLSDGDSAGVVTNLMSLGEDTGFYTIDYQADSPGQTLTVRWEQMLDFGGFVTPPGYIALYGVTLAPEPGTLALVGSGLLALAWGLRRRSGA